MTLLGLDRSSFELFGTARLTRAQSAHLDSWRGWSAVLVYVDHAVHIYGNRLHPTWQAIGGGAVMVFFVLSGFFIHKSLVRCFSQGRPMDFISARMDRILPPFAFALALTVLLWALAPFAFGGDRLLTSALRSEFSLRDLGITAVFLNGFLGGTLSANGPLWSLSYEVWYYILALLMALAITGRRWAWLFVPIVFCLAVVDWRFATLGSIWVLGFIVSVLHSNRRLPDLSHWPFAFVALVMFGVSLFNVRGDGIFYAFDIALGVWFAIYLAGKIRGEPMAFLPSMATFSYTLYVTHFPLLLFLRGADVSPWIAIPSIAVVIIWIGPRVERLRVFPRGHDRSSSGTAVQI